MFRLLKSAVEFAVGTLLADERFRLMNSVQLYGSRIVGVARIFIFILSFSIQHVSVHCVCTSSTC